MPNQQIQGVNIFGRSADEYVTISEDVNGNNALNVRTLEPTDQVYYFFDSDGNPIYIGVGSQGIATSASGWAITNIVWSSGLPVSKKHATGILDNRASLSYT